MQTSLEFLRGSRIQLSCQYLCPSSRARLLLLIRGFNCFPLRYHHNIGGSSITRYRSDTISAPFFVVWNVIKVSTKWCYTITKIYDLLQFFLTAFFLSDETCVRQVLQHLFQTLTKKMLTTVDIAHTPRYVLARCVFWADIGSDWYPMLPPDRVTPTSWVWQNPFSSSNTRLICNCCLTKVPKIRRWKEKCYVLLP